MDVMDCPRCRCSLWGIESRQCPQCEAPFKPSDFDFAPRTVRFCCPHCDQAYYGTDSRGHLEPAEFDCSRCGSNVHMDEMVLRPAEQPAVPAMPWLQRRQIGWWKGWFSTIGMALFSPEKLMRAAGDGRTGSALWFALITIVAVSVIGFFPLVAFLFVIASGILPELVDIDGGTLALGLVATFAGTMVFLVASVIVLTLLWGPVAHIVLRLTGRTAFGLRRTVNATLYSTGANAFTAVPFLGPYIGWIWWVVGAVLMLRSAQKVHAVRATAAVLALPIFFAGLLVAGVLFMPGGTLEARELREARNLEDPEQRLAALEEFVARTPSVANQRAAYLAIGETQEELGRDEDAVQAYLSAYNSGNTREIQEHLEAAYEKIHGSLDGLHEEIDKIELSSPELFEPGTYSTDSASGRVVLAEMFTGSECPPCVASDRAFDGLIERYDRQTLAVLEYHIHIPSPDPMTNPDTVERSGYYGVHSTPSVFVDGVRTGSGGGGASQAEHSFNVYKDAIESRLPPAPAVSISPLEVRRDGDRLIVSGRVTRASESVTVPEQATLRLVLAESPVHYTGFNGIHVHQFVVRTFLGGPSGFPLTALKEEPWTVQESVNLTDVSRGLASYLDSYQKGRPFFEWIQKMDVIDADRLAVVAFVQDDETMEILQAAFSR